jgi:hypothetical protein
MTRLSAFVLVLGVLATSCGDDPVVKRDATTTDGPRDMGGADRAPDTGGTPGMCVGTFSMLTRTQLGGLSTAGGKCNNMGDLDILCARDISMITRTEGGRCFLSGAMAQPALVMCVRDAVRMQLDPDLTDACLDCYLQAVACSVTNCATQCGLAPTSAMCLQCQMANNCIQNFFSCSGLPSGAPPDGGTTDMAAPGDGATGDRPADGTTGDTAPSDARPADGGAPDGGATDAAPADAAPADAAAADAAPADAAAADAAADGSVD